MGNVGYEIKEHIGTVREGSYPVELNMVSWGDRKPAYDLRRWKVDEIGERVPLKGIMLSESDMAVLKRILDGVELPEDE